jgi:voltage-gated potassium channel
MQKSLQELRDHFVVCGYGRMGQFVCQEFSSLGLSFVIVEKDGALLRAFSMPHGIPLDGDATSDDVLRQAGAERARGLVTTASSDAANLYITMSARFLNDKLFIVARAEEEGAEKKLLRAGANKVVSPYAIGGQRVAQAVLRPNVMDFLELATRSQHLELQIEETAISAASSLAGKSLDESRIRRDLGIIVVAIKKPNGTMSFNPEGAAMLDAGDLLITLGHRQQLDRLEQLAGG